MRDVIPFETTNIDDVVEAAAMVVRAVYKDCNHGRYIVGGIVGGYPVVWCGKCRKLYLQESHMEELKKTKPKRKTIRRRKR